MIIRRQCSRYSSTWQKLRSRTKAPEFRPKEGPKKPGKSFVHDYTVMPWTYSYITSGNEKNFKRFPLINAAQLAKFTERPRKLKMLARDFMDDSLYNPHYGYFNREVDIYSPNQPFSYNQISGDEDFMNTWNKEFKAYRDSADLQTTEGSRASKQIWHTPTELFKPFYGQALARYLLVNYKLSLYPYSDLIIYEMGAGNGTLMQNIMDYIRETEPDVYSRTKYRIIEISSQLATKQQTKIDEYAVKQTAATSGHQDKVEVINKSIFSWNSIVPEPCFFIALEVFDNFAHDVIRYDNTTFQPYQAYVVIDGNGDMQEVYSPNLDSLAREFLMIRNKLVDYVPAWELGFHPLSQPGYLRTLKSLVWPFRGNLSDPEYIPTRYLQFLHVLKDFFPEHRLLTSDFTCLTETIQGYNSPVVQTVLEQKMTPISSYMALQGFFDILFPTDFDLAAQLYTQVCGRLAKTTSHRSFLEIWADVDATKTRKGENPMLDFYQNAAFLYS